MITRRSAYRGCLLGLAVGDAMGYTVDTKSWAHIQEDYGPNGLMGYDLVNGYADVTSHAQLAAFTATGLLMGMTRGQINGKMAPFVRYAALAQREWATSQRRYDQPQRIYCWVYRVPELRRRRCTDTRMLDTLNRDTLGSPEEPTNRYDSPGALATAVAVGMFADRNRMAQEEIDRLGAESVALTHGSPVAFLSGAWVAHLVSNLLRDSGTPLEILMEEACEAVGNQFGREYAPAAKELRLLVMKAVAMARDRNMAPREVMEQLECESCTQVLAGAVYASLLCQEDFDSAMILAVNHSGRSAAVGCLTGAILGARMGAEALPEFYLESLEAARVLLELADDLVQGCPMVRGNRLFDGDWDRKYLHGEY